MTEMNMTLSKQGMVFIGPLAFKSKLEIVPRYIAHKGFYPLALRCFCCFPWIMFPPVSQKLRRSLRLTSFLNFWINNICIPWFQKISIPITWMVNPVLEGKGVWEAKILNEKYEPKVVGFSDGRRGTNEKPSLRDVWISYIFGTTHSSKWLL